MTRAAELADKLKGTNGARFDKLMRRDALMEAAADIRDDAALKTLRKLAPEVAKMVDDIDMKFADILARLQKIEDAEEAIRARPARILPPREPSGDEVLASMQSMTPSTRSALLNKLKQ